MTSTFDFLQIGFQKCGTTFFEESVYPAQPRLHCLQASKAPDLERFLLRHIILPDGLEYDRSAATEGLRPFLDKYCEPGRVNGLMFEPFTFLYERRFDRKLVIDRLKDLFPDARIITFVRNQKTWWTSHYSQFVKSGGRLGLRAFLDCELTNPFLDAHYVDWDPLIAYLHETFGQDRVCVGVYERLRESPQETADDVFSFLGLPRAEITRHPVNPSLGRTGLFLQRLFNRLVTYDCGGSCYGYGRDFDGSDASWPTRVWAKFVHGLFKPATHRMSSCADRILPFGKGAVIPASLLERIQKRYSANNRKLSERLSMDLTGRFGYP